MRTAVRGPAAVLPLVLTLAGAAPPAAAQLNAETKVVLHAIPGSSANRCWTPAGQGYDDCALETNTHVAPGARADVYVLLADYEAVDEVRFGVAWDASWELLGWHQGCLPGLATLAPDASGGDFEAIFDCQDADTLIVLGWFSCLAGDPGTELRIVDHSFPGGAGVFNCTPHWFTALGGFGRGAVGVDPAPGVNPCVEWMALDEPNGGETLVALGDAALRWRSFGHIDRVRFELSTDGGATFAVWPGAGDLPNTGAFDSIVPARPSGSCLVRVADTYNGSPADTSDASFTILPGIRVIEPGGGEIHYAGGAAPVSWWAAPHAGAARIDVSTDAGQTFRPIRTVAAGTRQFTWTDIPPPLSDRCLVRVLDLPSGHSDASAGLFTIAETIDVLELSPEVLQIGGEATLRWFASSTVAAVEIELSTDGGATFATLAAVFPGPPPDHVGVFHWTVEPPETAAGLIRVSDAEDGIPAGLSRTFSVAVAARVIAPNGGEILYAGEEREVRWFASPVIAVVRVDLSTDGGQSFTPVADAAPNTGSLPWEVPIAASTDCLVRVADAADGIPSDLSDAAFTLRPLAVVRPNGGELFCRGREEEIRWIAGPAFDAVRLEVSPDGGQSFEIIAASTPNDSSFVWAPPAGPDAPAAVVRVAVATDPALNDVSDSPFALHACPPIRVPAHVPTIREAMALAAPRDTVLVAPGTYAERGIRLKGGVWLLSEAGAEATVIDGGGEGEPVLVGEPGNTWAVVEGFTITGGWVPAAVVLESPAEFVGCTLKANASWAVTLRNRRRAALRGCITASNGAGGMQGGGLKLVDCEITGNAGPGIDAHGEVRADRCLVRANAGYAGILMSGGTLTLRECIVTDHEGFGISMAYGNATFEDCVIAGNHWGLGCYASYNYVERCLFHDNLTAVFLMAGIYYTSYADIDECTIASNGNGIAAYCGNYKSGCSGAHIERSIIAFASGGRLLNLPCRAGYESRIGCSLLYPPPDSSTCFIDLGENLAVDPRFCDMAGGDFHLALDSPALEHPACGRLGALGAGCPLGPTAVEALPGPVPARAFLAGPRPNPLRPSNPGIRLTLGLPARGVASLRIYDIAGRLVRVLADGPLEAGVHDVLWDGKDERGAPVASGVYMCRVEAPGLDATRKLAVLR